MFNILEHYKNLNVEGREFAPQQIVAVGKHWNKNIHLLTKEYMNDPYIVITSMEEAAIYGNVQQVKDLVSGFVCVTLDSEGWKKLCKS